MFTSEGVEGYLCWRCHDFVRGGVLHGVGRKQDSNCHRKALELYSSPIVNGVLELCNVS